MIVGTDGLEGIRCIAAETNTHPDRDREGVTRGQEGPHNGRPGSRTSLGKNDSPEPERLVEPMRPGEVRVWEGRGTSKAAVHSGSTGETVAVSRRSS